MGVNWRHHIWYGIKTRYLESLDDIDIYEEVGKLSILRDGMNGEYCVIGIPIFISEDGRFEEADIPFIEIKNLDDKTKNKIIKFARKYGVISEPKILVFTHYT